MPRIRSRSALRPALLALAVPASLALATPVEARTDYYGGGFISDFNNCPGWGTQVQQVTARLRPAGISTNGPRSSLSIFFHTGAQNYSIEGDLPRGWTPMQAVSVWSTAWLQDNPAPEMRLQSGSTFNIREGTSVVDLVGQIRHFDGIQGCRVDFQLILFEFPR